MRGDQNPPAPAVIGLLLIGVTSSVSSLSVRACSHHCVCSFSKTWNNLWSKQHAALISERLVYSFIGKALKCEYEEVDLEAVRSRRKSSKLDNSFPFITMFVFVFSVQPRQNAEAKPFIMLIRDWQQMLRASHEKKKKHGKAQEEILTLNNLS